jgi:hypothetical protein
MGFKRSPYNATWAFAWCEELIQGNGQEEEILYAGIVLE